MRGRSRSKRNCEFPYPAWKFRVLGMVGNKHCCWTLTTRLFFKAVVFVVDLEKNCTIIVWNDIEKNNFDCCHCSAKYFKRRIDEVGDRSFMFSWYGEIRRKQLVRQWKTFRQLFIGTEELSLLSSKLVSSPERVELRIEVRRRSCKEVKYWYRK